MVTLQFSPNKPPIIHMQIHQTGSFTCCCVPKLKLGELWPVNLHHVKWMRSVNFLYRDVYDTCFIAYMTLLFYCVALTEYCMLKLKCGHCCSQLVFKHCHHNAKPFRNAKENICFYYSSEIISLHLFFLHFNSTASALKSRLDRTFWHKSS